MLLRDSKTAEIIIALALLMAPLLLRAEAEQSSAIPEEARKHFVMGMTMFKEAKSAADFSQAAQEFAQAAQQAPSWPEARYNLALAKEAAGDNPGALADLKLYQQFKLSESEARKVQDKIYSLEAKQKMAAGEAEKVRTEVATEKSKKEDYERRIGFLAGSWTMTVDIFAVRRDPRWYPKRFNYVVTCVAKDSQIKLDLAGLGSFNGTLNGNDYRSISWEYRAGEHENYGVPGPTVSADRKTMDWRIRFTTSKGILLEQDHVFHKQ